MRVDSGLENLSAWRSHRSPPAPWAPRAERRPPHQNPIPPRRPTGARARTHLSTHTAHRLTALSPKIQDTIVRQSLDKIAIWPYIDYVGNLAQLAERAKELTSRQRAMLLVPESGELARRLNNVIEAAEAAGTEREVALAGGFTPEEFGWLMSMAQREDSHPVFRRFFGEYLEARGRAAVRLSGKVYDTALSDEGADGAVGLLKVMERGTWNEPKDRASAAPTTVVNVVPVWLDEDSPRVIDV